MSLIPAFMLARSFLTGRRGRGEKGQRYLLGAILGVALSLVPLIVVLVVSDGMIEGITARYIETGTYHLQVSIPGGQTTPDSMASAVAELRRIPGIASAIPETQGPGIVLSGGKTTGALIRAVGQDFFSDPGVARFLETTEGSTDAMKGRDVILGEALARNLGLKPGDSLSLMTANAYISGTGEPELIPKLSFFRVKAVVSAGYRELDSLWIFLTPESGAKILAADTSRSIIGIKVDEPYGSNLDMFRLRIEERLRAPVLFSAFSWYVRTWPEIEQSLFKSFSTTKALLMLIMAVAVAVAAVNVGSALSMLVVERRQDIAVLKATGGSSAFIGLVFLLAGLAAGGVGTMAGIATGSLISLYINDIIIFTEKSMNAISRLLSSISGNPFPEKAIKLLDPSFYLSSIPVEIDPGSLIWIAVLSLLLCSVVSLVPAQRAARLSPLEITRKI